MNKYFISCLVSAFIVLPNTIFSQAKTDFLNLSYSIISNGQFKDKAGEAKLSHFDFNCITPTIKLGSKVKINNVLYYRFSQYNYSGFSDEQIQLPVDFHEIKYTMFARYTFNPNWELLLVPKLSVRSDFNSNLNEKDLFPAVSTILMKTSLKNDKVKWGFGLNYNNDLGKNSVIPIIAFNYLSDKMRCSAFFPNNANLTFTSLKKIEYGLAFTTDATLIHVNTLDSIEYIRTLNVHLNPTFSYNLASNFWLNLKAGIVLRRKYDLYTADFVTPSDDFENKLKSSGFLQLGISLRTKS